MDDRKERIEWFKTAVLPHEPPLRRHLYRTGVRSSEVDDVVAESLARAYTTKDFRRMDRGRSLLFAIARNLLIDEARRRRVVSFETIAEIDSLNLTDEQPSAETVVTAREELQRLAAIVSRFPPRCREVFVLRRVEGLAMDAIAARLGLSVSTVEKHLTKSMVLLTRALAEHDPITSVSAGIQWGAKRRTS